MYIVTGATGHIGNNVCRYLTSLGCEVHAIVRKMDTSLESMSIKISINPHFDYAFLDSVIKPKDIIIHCAAYIDLMNKSLMNSFRTNVQLTKHLVDLAKKKNCRFVYLSSVDVIPKKKRGLVNEPLQIDRKMTKSFYKTSKSVATNYVLENLQKGLNGVVLYPSAVVGIHDYKPSAAGREILHAVRHRILFSLHGGYNFIDVEDVSRSIYQASLLNINEQIILSAHEITIRGLYEMIERVTKKEKWIIPLPIFLVRIAILFMKNYSQMMISTIQENYHYDNTKMINILHVVPKPLDLTLSETICFLTEFHKI